MTPKTQSKAKTSLRDEARRAVESCAGWNGRAAARRISRFLDRRLEKAGLNTAQFGLMAEIASIEDDSLGALADRTGLEPSTLSRNLRILEADGLVEIALVERDQRRRAVWLTEKGLRRLEAGLPVWQDAHRALTKLLDPTILRRVALSTEALDRLD